MITSMLEVRQRLADRDLPDRLGGLGLRPDDAADLHRAAAAAVDRPEDLETLATVADRIVTRLGDFTAGGHPAVWWGLPLDAEGVLPLLALLVTAPEVADWHARRGIPAEVSAAALSDLGQQAWVHRLAFGTFGLHTHDWLTIAWSGALYWLGRLQFNLQPEDDGWVLSTHIPRTGPLTPESVDHAFAAASDFFATYFPEYPVRAFLCASWLLDPALTAALPSSNLAAFQRRWQLTGQRQSGEADVLFFVFNRLDPTEFESLPADTALRRAIRDQLVSGLGWSTVTGRIPRDH